MIGTISVAYSVNKAKKLPFITSDILGQNCSEPAIGALQNKGEKQMIELATSKNCGPRWYQPILSVKE